MSKPLTRSQNLVALIDDDASFRRATDRLLRAYGWHTRCFESAVEFLNTKEKEEFTCLLIDIHMPELDGCDLLKRLRERGDTTPCLLVTAHKLNEPQGVIAEKYAKGIISKPYEVTEMIEAIERTRE